MNQEQESHIIRPSVLIAMAATFALLGRPCFAQAPDPGEMPKRPSIAIEGVAVVDVVRGEILNPRTVLIVDERWS